MGLDGFHNSLLPRFWMKVASALEVHGDHMWDNQFKDQVHREESQKPWKMTETLARGYSARAIQWIPT